MPSPREIRLDRLRPAPLEVPAGVIILPAMVPRRLWPLSVLIERVSAEGSYADLTPCPSCDYPREATACVSCAVGHRSLEPRTTALRPPSGVFKLPFDWIESRFLHQTQFSWCVEHGARIYDCGYDHALANNQTRCLVCLDMRLRGEQDDWPPDAA